MSDGQSCLMSNKGRAAFKRQLQMAMIWLQLVSLSPFQDRLLACLGVAGRERERERVTEQDGRVPSRGSPARISVLADAPFWRAA